jgi:hypothetical protein
MNNINNPQKICKDFFLKPQNPMHKRYEALRAAYVDEIPDEDIAEEYGYTFYSFKSIKRDVKEWDENNFFKELRRGPKGHQKKTATVKDRMIELRKKNYSVIEIQEKLKREGTTLSVNHINLILKREGFGKLFRRTNREQLEAKQEDKNYPEIANRADFGKHNEVETSFGGIFLFLPLLRQLKLDELFRNNNFYGSEMIPSVSYLMSYLSLKLLGKERICHVNDFNFDYGLGVFAGLNVLPKSTAITQYSYRHGPKQIRSLLKGFVKLLHQQGYLKGANINLDFHVIPHYGEESVLEDHWVPTRAKQMKSVLSFFAQDLDTTFLCFSNGNIQKKEINDEVLEFVNFYKETTGLLPERLIFDSKLTTYEKLNQLNEQGILFITLKRRGRNFIKDVEKVKDWKRIRLDHVQRKYRNLEISEESINIKDYDNKVRSIIVKGTGRELPMNLITNDEKSTPKELLTHYAKRWRVENNIQENVDFFNLNALSSPVVVKVDFDIALTLISNTLYKIFAEKTKWFKSSKSKTISRNFINSKAAIELEDHQVKVTFAKKSYNPVLIDWINSLENITIPWWNNKKIVYDFE